MVDIVKWSIRVGIGIGLVGTIIGSYDNLRMQNRSEIVVQALDYHPQPQAASYNELEQKLEETKKSLACDLSFTLTVEYHRDVLAVGVAEQTNPRTGPEHHLLLGGAYATLENVEQEVSRICRR